MTANASPPVLWIGGYDNQPEVNEAVGRKPAGRSVIANLGPSWNGNQVKEMLGKCAAAEQTPVIWAGPTFAELDAGTVDFAALPDHPSVAALATMLAAVNQPVLVRLLYEFANRTPSGQLRYRTPAEFRTLYDALAAKLPPNAIPVWSFGPGWKNPVDFAAWRPASAKVADVSMYRKDATYLTGAGALVTQFVQVAKALGLPLIVGESGLGGYFPPAAPTDEELKAHAVALIKWCAENNVRALAGPFNSTAYGMVPWAGKPLTAAYLAKKLGSGGFISKPLAAVAPKDPLVAAGIVPL